jgi:hypothetical protein
MATDIADALPSWLAEVSRESGEIYEVGLEILPVLFLARLEYFQLTSNF